MFWQNLLITHKLALAPINLTGDIAIPESTSIVFSSPNFFLALITGVVMAFAFQLLLTNLSLGLRFLGMGYADYTIDDTANDRDTNNNDTLGNTIRKNEAKIGIWLIFTSTIALFIACFLAVKLSLIESAFLGAIMGVVIWSSYFSIIVWLGSSALGSLIGSLATTVASGIQSLVNTATSAATSAIGASTAQKQMVATAEEITAAVRRELTSGFNGENIQNNLQNNLQNYLSSRQFPKLDIKEIRNQFDQILQNVDLQGINSQELLENINRQTFVDLISSRMDLSVKEVDQIADQLEGAWKQIFNQQNATKKLVNLLKSSSPEELKSEKLGERLQELIQVDGGNGKQKEGVIDRAIQYSLKAVGTAVLDRVNLSDVNLQEVTSELKKLGSSVEDVDVNKIIEQVKHLANQTSEKAGWVGNQVVERLSPQSSSNIKADVEEYIRNSFPWHFNRVTLQAEFPEVIYDQNADPRIVLRDLNQIDRDYLTNLLQQRGDIQERNIAEITDQLETIRQEVLETVQQVQTQDPQAEVETIPDRVQEQYEQTITAITAYLRNTNLDELNPEGIQRDLQKLFSQPQAGVWAIRDRLAQIDRETLVKLLSQRQDLSEEQVNQIIDYTQQAITNIIKAPRRLAERTTKQVREFGENLANYLRQTHKEELNPEGIKRDLQLLLSSPSAGMENISDRLAQFDRSTLIALLSQREDISFAEANQIVDQIESVRDSIVAQFQRIQQKLQEITDGVLNKIRDYLNSLERPELNYDQIQQDFAKLFDDPQAGWTALRDRLAQFDRNTLVALLSSRPDISSEQANQIINRIESARDSVLSQAERIQQETQKRLKAVQDQVRQQAIDSGKAVTEAAWWLFNVALFSLVASAIAGAVAVIIPSPLI